MLSCIGPEPYQTNPNFKLLVGDTTTYDGDSIHCGYPVVSPDGRKVYYLCVDADYFSPLEGCIGSIYSINMDGSNNQKILDGKFEALSISHNGEKLAVHSYKGNYPNLDPESLILVINLDSLNVDSFWVASRRIEKIAWGSNDRYLYYYNYKQILRLDLLTNTEEIIATISIAGFDLFKNDSIYFDSTRYSTEIEPVSEKIVVGVSGWGFGTSLLIRDISLGTERSLPVPYNDGLVGFPYWFPDGNTIVFAAQPYVEATGAPAEIWILENVLEYIKELGGINESY